jgi:hypothetical protein
MVVVCVCLALVNIVINLIEITHLNSVLFPI